MLLVLRLLPLRIHRAWRRVPDEVRLTHVLREKSGSLTRALRLFRRNSNNTVYANLSTR